MCSNQLPPLHFSFVFFWHFLASLLNYASSHNL
jgi:hypothetical protein